MVSVAPQLPSTLAALTARLVPKPFGSLTNVADLLIRDILANARLAFDQSLD